jgi:hypothetical protein
MVKYSPRAYVSKNFAWFGVSGSNFLSSAALIRGGFFSIVSDVISM